MRKCTLPIILGTMLVFIIASCTEEPAKTYAEGTLECTTSCSGSPYVVSGPIARSGTNRYGWCERDGKKLSFVVGSAEQNDATSGNDFYFEVSNVEGPPSKGVYDGDDNPRQDEEKEFGSIFIKNVNEWYVEGGQYDECHVVQYSEAKEGELTPKGEPFDIYVAVSCADLEINDSNSSGAFLDTIYISIFFDNC